MAIRAEQTSDGIKLRDTKTGKLAGAVKTGGKQAPIIQSKPATSQVKPSIGPNPVQGSIESLYDSFVDMNDTTVPELQLDSRQVPELGLTVAEYVREHGNKGKVLDSSVESLYMNGGCAVYALAFEGLYGDECEIAVDVWECDGEPVYNHVFCVNKDTGKAYDARGEFTSPESLTNYGSDPGFDGTVLKEGLFYKDLGYKTISKDKLLALVGEEHFTFDPTVKDLGYTKNLIMQFKGRISQ